MSTIWCALLFIVLIVMHLVYGGWQKKVDEL